MNDIIANGAIKSYEKGFSHGMKVTSLTQVIGATVIVVGGIRLAQKGYRTMINRAVRKELKNQK